MPSKLTQWVRNYFGFSRTESRGFLVLLSLLIVLLISPFVLDLFPDSVQDSPDVQKLDTLMDQLEVQSETQKAYTEHDSRDYNHSPTSVWVNLRVCSPLTRIPSPPSNGKS